MADPLSIAASITGLIALAGQMSTILSKFIADVTDAPGSARAALSAIEEMRLALVSVKQVMDRLQAQPRHRRQMIHVKHLAIVFRESVLSVSKLEAILKPMAAAPGGMLDRFKWIREEDKILRCLTQLESHKTSFCFILSVLQSESEMEAQDSLNSLRSLVERLVEQNQDILIRLEQHECTAGDASVRFFEDTTSTYRPTPRRTYVQLDAEFLDLAIAREFDATLEASRVYRRVQSYEDIDGSFRSSVVRSNVWSMLSELSLSDISAVSVIALPLTLDEINDIGSKLTFARIISEHEGSSGSAPVEVGVSTKKAFKVPQPRLPQFKIPRWRSSTKSAKEAETQLITNKDRADLQSDEVRVLLLGAHQTGMSTFLKQLDLLTGNGFTEENRKGYRHIIFNNVMSPILLALETMERYEIDFELPENEYQYVHHRGGYYTGDEHFPQQLLPRLQALWEDKGVQAALAKCNEHGLLDGFLNDSMHYYFSHLDRLFDVNYIPSEQDILYSTVKTVGVTESEFKIEPFTYRVFNAGGVRSERKKWGNMFKEAGHGRGIDAVIFFAAVSEYDQCLAEDDTVNRMQESLALFDSICNSQRFTQSKIILFLNKIDQFKQKLPRQPLEKYFPDYQGGNDFNAACQYILDRFTSLNKREDKPIYTHFTCAVDVEHTRSVFGKVNDLIVEHNTAKKISIL